MTPEQQQHLNEVIEQAIKDTAVHVKNSTERTNSSLIADLWEKFKGELKPTLKPIIDELVNGKINNLTEMQTAQNLVLEDIQEQILKITQDTEPIIEQSKEKTIIKHFIDGLASGTIRIGVTIGALTVIAGALYWLLTHFPSFFQ